MKLILHLLSISVLLCSSVVLGKTLNMPLKLENAFIEQLVKAQVFTGKNNTLRFNEDSSGCQFVEISEPKVSVVHDRLKVRVKARIRMGQPVGSRQCFYLVKWNGFIDLYHDIQLSADGKKIHVVVKKSEVLNQAMKRDELADTLWQGISAQLYPKLQSLVIDLHDPIENLKTVLPYVVAPKNTPIFQKSLDSLMVDTVAINAQGVLVGMQVTVPNLVPLSKNTVVTLTGAELVLLEKKLDAIDAFTTFVLKQFLTPTLPEDIRYALFAVLFDVRYEIVRILESPAQYGADPVRQLFLNTWAELSPIIHQISGKYNKPFLGLRLLSFVTASDALAAIDQYGADLGLDVSVNGLRRLARLLNDDPNIDPIEKSDDEDIELRKLFGLSQVVFASEDEKISTWFEDRMENGLDFFIPLAEAMKKKPITVKLPTKLIKKLNNWVPKNKEISLYLPMVKKVLAAVSQAQLDAKKLDKPVRKIYRELVYAAAWQESCWKQFSNIKGFRKPLRSYSGDLGLMQINPRVWRGFYSVHKLKWDIVYNANAGAEILMHYMTRYVIRNKEHIKTGKMENIARATYSGYNGGPSQYTRYRKKNISGKLKQIDRAFYKKYKAVRDKGSMSVKSCYVGI